MKTWLLLGALIVFSSLGEILSSRGMKQVGNISFVLQDGGMTMYNNPAFQLFLRATVEAYNLGHS